MATVAWPLQEAKRIIKTFPQNKGKFVFETGYGPSGLPHIGTFGEVVRTSFVIQALKILQPEADIQLITFSDDMDGLRNLPENVPDHTRLRHHLGAPLSSIPDPYQETDSYAAYMNKKLCHFLDSFGFDYQLRSSTECYKTGVFDQGLKRIMDNYDKIRDIFIRTIAEEKRATWSPFFPVCQSCGKIYSTRVTEVDTQRYEIQYSCDQDGKLYRACGNKGVVPITGGNVKVGWKVDWALRWHVLGINYEMYGKDLMESATISAKICRVLGSTPPVLYKYELFLDEKGAKISKKIGNGLSMEQWMRYAPFGALLNFLVSNPNKAKKMGLPLLPRLIDEYLQTLKTQNSSLEGSPLWYLAQIQNKPLSDQNKIEGNLSFSLLYNVAASLSISDPSLLYDYAVKYEPAIQANADLFLELCKNVAALVSDQQGQAEELDFTPNEAFYPHLEKILKEVQSATEEILDGSELQKFIFSIAKEQGIEQKAWFEFLYQTILGRNQGPKIGPFFAMLGREKAISLLKKALLPYTNRG
jgi:lysyl-tRNA synthetase class 1